MKDLDKLLRCMEEHVDIKIDSDFLSFGGTLFDRKAFYDEIRQLLEGEGFDEVMESPDEEYCAAVLRTLCRTICLCREMDEMEVPEDIHSKLLKAIEEELKD